METSQYYALGIPLYGVLMMFEAWLGRRRRVRVYRLADDLGNLACGMGQILAGLFLGPLMLSLYSFGYELRVFTMPAKSPLTWLLSAVLVDLCYYFYHRAGHRLRVLWAVHNVHHQSDGFNFAVALRQPWISDLYAVFFYFPLPLLGVPLDVFFACVALLSLNQITLHTRLLPRPSLYVFNTPALHELHHACNAPYADMNFGATLILWDRLFGTYVEPDPEIAPILGTTAGYTTHDSVTAQFTVARSMLLGPTDDARAIDSDAIPLAQKRHALALFVLTTCASALVLVERSHLTTPMLIAATVSLLTGYHAVGRILAKASAIGNSLASADLRRATLDVGASRGGGASFAEQTSGRQPHQSQAR